MATSSSSMSPVPEPVMADTGRGCGPICQKSAACRRQAHAQSQTPSSVRAHAGHADVPGRHGDCDKLNGSDCSLRLLSTSAACSAACNGAPMQSIQAALS